MAQPTPVRLGLYYPFIQFRSDSWLKLAALYWDQISRIVPPGYDLHDSDMVRRLQEELGFVVDLAPSGSAIDSVSSEFLELLTECGPELSDLYGMQGKYLFEPNPVNRRWPQPWANVPRPLDIPQWHMPVDPSLVPGSDPRLSYIYANGKMTPQLESALIDANLGVPVRTHGLIGMHPQLAFVYMNSLASKMASSAMCLLTDDDFEHIAAGCATDRLAAVLLDFRNTWDAQDSDAESLSVEFAMLTLRSVIPKDISSLPVQKIIKIRQRHMEELTRFQQATNTIIASVPEAVSVNPEARAMYLQALYKKTLEPELRRLKSSLHKSGVDSVFGSMSIKVQAPQIVTSGMAIFGIGALHLNPVMMGTGAVVLCLVPKIRRQRAEAQKLRAESSAAYLLRLEEQLEPTSLAPRMATRAGRLMRA
jgi:hypothetical protein